MKKKRIVPIPIPSPCDTTLPAPGESLYDPKQWKKTSKNKREENRK